MRVRRGERNNQAAHLGCSPARYLRLIVVIGHTCEGLLVKMWWDEEMEGGWGWRARAK